MVWSSGFEPHGTTTSLFTDPERLEPIYGWLEQRRGVLVEVWGLEGGRRAEAIALFEQFLSSNAAEDAKKAAKVFLDELRGQVKQAEAGTDKPPR